MSETIELENSPIYKAARSTQVTTRRVGIAFGIGAMLAPIVISGSASGSRGTALGLVMVGVPLSFLFLTIGIVCLVIAMRAKARAESMLSTGVIPEPEINKTVLAAEFSTDAMMGKLASPESGDEK